MSNWNIICQYINSHKNTWQEDFANIGIKVKNSGDFYIFNYDITCDFNNPLCRAARGVIINIADLSVVGVDFDKFFNSHESYADPIDWSTARVQEKIDGSIVKLWYITDDQWMFSSNACIRAADAKLNSGYTVLDLIKETDEFAYLENLIKNGELDEHNTYIFELVGPKNRVVIKYDEARLYHIGTRNNETGKELGTGQFAGFIMSPREYPLHSLEDCIKAAEKLNQQKEDEALDLPRQSNDSFPNLGSGAFPRLDENGFPNHEGFVVVDGNYNRVKIKSPEYLIYHLMINNGQINKERAYDLLTSDDFNFDAFMKSAPEYACEAVAYYNEQMSQVKEEIRSLVDRVREMAANGKTRKEIAEAIKTEPVKFYAFKALGCEESADQIISDYGRKIMGFIEDFQPACGLEENIEDNDEERDL